jgi:predicted chitinase
VKLRELFEGVGRIVPGVNTTPDVGPDQVSKEAAKFGFKVDKDGVPPTLSKKVKGKSTNVLFNLGLTESEIKSYTYTPMTSSPNEMILANVAQASGITGVELAAFMSQMAHESEYFKDMVEDRPNIKKYSSGKTAKMLGNKSENDAKRFVGRGFIQLTGRWNYKWMEKELGIDLTSTWSNAHKAADPTIAAKIAVVFWKSRVRPKVSDWSDVKQVTAPINPKLHGIGSRATTFKDSLKSMMQTLKAKK